eukprot:CAMPEP_0114597536 /NCGR_PEP_ID=MMETSP0125-20121206/19829_1 /TAXON_ID=485358 ORGANISM="Aristerostoma sp., Strain ATCC 50986" /NCGR_SAMPLE_ID=MMETSP0125 /ASSEMBLY_ACC=CAM_ASM_000245 /LENGTH=44 /DNA_ID= /DNA_START= /DNA_END= /DNA_ORIENTATION=
MIFIVTPIQKFFFYKQFVREHYGFRVSSKKHKKQLEKAKLTDES